MFIVFIIIITILVIKTIKVKLFQVVVYLYEVAHNIKIAY